MAPNTNQPAKDEWLRFRELLDSQHEWPARYPFKFIVPKAELPRLEALLEGTELTVRASKRGNYLSVSARFLARSADDIVAIYESAARIEGVISL